MIPFHQTPMGRKFYERDVPKIQTALESIAHELKRSNDLKEKESAKEEETTGE